MGGQAVKFAIIVTLAASAVFALAVVISGETTTSVPADPPPTYQPACPTGMALRYGWEHHHLVVNCEVAP